jgi:hypothetical protein
MNAHYTIKQFHVGTCQNNNYWHLLKKTSYMYETSGGYQAPEIASIAIYRVS